MVTDFSADDKASGVKFCMSVFISVQGMQSPIFVNFASPEAQIGWIGQHASHTHPHVNITVEMYERKRHATDASFVKSRGVWT